MKMRLKFPDIGRLKLEPIEPIHKVYRFNASESLFKSNHEITYELNNKTYEIAFDDLKRVNHEKTLGQGVSSVVIEMFDERTKKSFAVKRVEKSFYHRIIENYYENNSINQMIEINFFDKITNFEHIIQYYGYFNHESYIWIVCELMDCSLQEFYESVLHSGKEIPESLIAKIAYSALKAFSHLNELNIIHGDIKPTNMLVNSQGDIKLCDFGEATLIDDKCENKNKGSDSYKAPEKFDATSTTCSIKSDIWSLGISLAELATLTKPFKDSVGVLSLKTAICDKEMPKLKSFGLERVFSAELQDFLDLCLQKDTEKRGDVEALLNHKFITMHAINDRDLEFLRDVIKEIKK